MTTYVTSLLGHVASYGLRADHAVQVLIQRTLDEFSLIVCQKTGINFEFLTRLKADAAGRVMRGQVTEPGLCKGRTKHGAPCKKRTLLGYCHDHQHQEELAASKRRRIQAHVAHKSFKEKVSIVPLKFRFT